MAEKDCHRNVKISLVVFNRLHVLYTTKNFKPAFFYMGTQVRVFIFYQKPSKILIQIRLFIFSKASIVTEPI